jgi:hypothetical protein
MRDQKRVQMRVRETIKYWNLMMENFSQVVMEGGVECEAMKKKVYAMQDKVSKALLKAYNYGVVKGGKR